MDMFTAGSHVARWKDSWGKEVFFGMNVLYERRGMLHVGDEIDVLRLSKKGSSGRNTGRWKRLAHYFVSVEGFKGGVSEIAVVGALEAKNYNSGMIFDERVYVIPSYTRSCPIWVIYCGRSNSRMIHTL